MHAPKVGCDGPGCSNDLVALIRGVGLCEVHLQELQDQAANQDVDPFSLSRQVILQLLTRQAQATAQQRLAAIPPAKRAAPPPGYYWVHEQGQWTVVEMFHDGQFTRLGSSQVFSLSEHSFARMLPIRPPR